MEFISLLLNLVFGGGFLVSLLTMRSTRKKAEADAKTSELDNVQEAVKIWREMCESLKSELEDYKTYQGEMNAQMEMLRREVARLTAINHKIVLLLDKITPENMEQMIDQIKTVHGHLILKPNEINQ
ncbi:hypothetical protein LX69_01146 [Breznakibacter xylanolyticus]|uniref:Uncharacterized protein n=1 Tax=Breznakibacter xylanolyticus TaxID=990 RepID=A0A2W7Q8T9_9BACT|nr:hypothetical protein [Breznakibacter xylanolyticus]PZX18109.1 hypothetical protein LX69_01146 [Breznakibacter xylanolyticus]